MNKPKILHCCPSPGPLGGIWTYIRHIQESRLADKYRFETCFYPGPSVGVSGRVIRAFRQNAKSKKPDLVHLHGLQTEGFNCMMGVMLGTDAPRLLAVHGFIEDSRFRSPWRQTVIAKILEPVTVLCADATYTVSQYGAAKPVIKRWARHNLGWVGNAVPPGPPRNQECTRTARSRYGWTPQNIVAVCVARISIEKGFLDLSEAFDCAFRHEPTLRLIVVGDGPDIGLIRGQLAAYIADGRVVFENSTFPVQDALAVSDFFILPSLHENQSFAILEAMDAGLPVLSTKTGGTPELVSHDKTGILVPPGDPHSLAAAIIRITSSKSLRMAMGAAGREATQTHHSYNVFIAKIQYLYDQLLDAHLPIAVSPSARQGNLAQ